MQTRHHIYTRSNASNDRWNWNEIAISKLMSRKCSESYVKRYLAEWRFSSKYQFIQNGDLVGGGCELDWHLSLEIDRIAYALVVYTLQSHIRYSDSGIFKLLCGLKFSRLVALSSISQSVNILTCNAHPQFPSLSKRNLTSVNNAFRQAAKEQVCCRFFALTTLLTV